MCATGGGTRSKRGVGEGALLSRLLLVLLLLLVLASSLLVLGSVLASSLLSLVFGWVPLVLEASRLAVLEGALLSLSVAVSLGEVAAGDASLLLLLLLLPAVLEGLGCCRDKGAGITWLHKLEGTQTYREQDMGALSHDSCWGLGRRSVSCAPGHYISERRRRIENGSGQTSEQDVPWANSEPTKLESQKSFPDY